MAYLGKKNKRKTAPICDRCNVVNPGELQVLTMPNVDKGMHRKKQDLKFNFCQKCAHKLLSWILDGKDRDPHQWSMHRRGE